MAKINTMRRRLLKLLLLALVVPPGFLLPAAAEDLAFTHPLVFNGAITVFPSEVKKVDLVTSQFSSVTGALASDGTSGLAFDSDGNLYYGEIDVGPPLTVELMKRAPGGTTSSLGIVVDTTGGFVTTAGFAFDLAVSSANELFFTHPRVFNGAITLTPSQIKKVDLVTSQISTVTFGLASTGKSGLAFDPDGNLYYGEVQIGPIAIELMKRTPGGSTSSLGIVVDTSGGFISDTGLAFDLAVKSGELFFTHPRVFDGVGVTVIPSRIMKVDLTTFLVNAVTNGLATDRKSGLAFDSQGNLYYGEVAIGPTTVELKKRIPGGSTSSLGIVVDTSAGAVFTAAFAFDLRLERPPATPIPALGGHAVVALAVLIVMVAGHRSRIARL